MVKRVTDDEISGLVLTVKTLITCQFYISVSDNKIVKQSAIAGLSSSLGI